MNYYAKWWNQARQNPGTILTTRERHRQALREKEVVIGQLQTDLITLQNSVDVAIVENLEKTVRNKDKQIQALKLLAEDRKQKLEQEQTALISLAKQKLANKKEAQALFNQLESQWNQAKANLETQINQKDQAWHEKNQAYEDFLTATKPNSPAS